jgi:hypothetical protein
MLAGLGLAGLGIPAYAWLASAQLDSAGPVCPISARRTKEPARKPPPM